MNNADDQKEYPQGGQPIIIYQMNGLGTAGFVLAVIALFFGVVPILGWSVWGLGLIFSVVGIFKKPRGLSIAGLAISVIGLILIISLSATVVEYFENLIETIKAIPVPDTKGIPLEKMPKTAYFYSFM